MRTRPPASVHSSARHLLWSRVLQRGLCLLCTGAPFVSAAGLHFGPSVATPLPGIYESYLRNDQGDALVAADLDGDGRAELIIAAHSGLASAAQGSLWVGTVGSTGALTLTALPLSAGLVQQASVMNVDGDIHPDLVTQRIQYSPHRATLEFWRGRGDGTFDAPQALLSLDDVQMGFSVADLDADGDVDLVVNTYDYNGVYQLTTVRNDGAGVLQVAGTSLGTLVAQRLFDFDDDGFPDALGAGSTLISGDGAGGFLAPCACGLPTAVADWEPVDHDQDGDSDLITVTAASGEPNPALALEVLRNDGGNHVALGATTVFGGAMGRDPSIAIPPADLDGDGTLDVAIPVEYSDLYLTTAERGVAFVRLGSDGSFSQGQGFRVGNQPAIGDLDGDGLIDLAGFAADGSGTVVNVRFGDTGTNVAPQAALQQIDVVVGSITTGIRTTATDADGNILRYRMMRPPTKGLAAVDAATGGMTYVSHATGDDSFAIEVADFSGATVMMEVAVRATERPHASTEDREGGGGAPGPALLALLALAELARRRRARG